MFYNKYTDNLIKLTAEECFVYLLSLNFKAKRIC